LIKSSIFIIITIIFFSQSVVKENKISNTKIKLVISYSTIRINGTEGNFDVLFRQTGVIA